MFFENRPVQPTVHAAIRNALETVPGGTDLDTEAAARTSAVVDQIRAATTFHSGRFLVALVVFIAIVGAAVVTDAFRLPNSPQALFGLAGTMFGVIVGFLGGEKGP